MFSKPQLVCSMRDISLTIVPYGQIDTTQTIEANNTGFVITGGDISRQIQILPGGDCTIMNVSLPTKHNSGTAWNDLAAREGYAPIENFYLQQ